jgi:hypothetical protein
VAFVASAGIRELSTSAVKLHEGHEILISNPKRLPCFQFLSIQARQRLGQASQLLELRLHAFSFSNRRIKLDDFSFQHKK